MTTNRTHTKGRRLAIVSVFAIFGLSTGACGGNSTEPTATDDTSGAGPVAAEPTVSVTDNEFIPTELTVEAGTTANWIWNGNAQHNVVGDTFESDIQVDGNFEHTFDRPGTYTYVCTLHQGMDGTIFVVDG